MKISDEIKAAARSVKMRHSEKHSDYAERAIEAVAPMILEEAAKMAEGYPSEVHGSLEVSPVAASDQTAREIAAAIRAMGEGSPPTD